MAHNHLTGYGTPPPDNFFKRHNLEAILKFRLGVLARRIRNEKFPFKARLDFAWETLAKSFTNEDSVCAVESLLREVRNIPEIKKLEIERSVEIRVVLEQNSISLIHQRLNVRKASMTFVIRIFLGQGTPVSPPVEIAKLSMDEYRKRLNELG